MGELPHPNPHSSTGPANEEAAVDTAWVVWIHGGLGSGKTTLAALLADRLGKARRCVVLDEPVFRQTVSPELGFDLDSQRKNIQRAAKVAEALVSQGATVFAAFETATQELRDLARSAVGGAPFVEVALRCSAECIGRRAFTANGLVPQPSTAAVGPSDPFASAEIRADSELFSADEVARFVENELRIYMETGRALDTDEEGLRSPPGI